MSASARLAPPKPVPKPGHVKVVRALYKYNAQQIDELSFEEGDILYVLDQTTDSSWWKASCEGKIGLIPSNYVEENTEEILHPLHEAAKRGHLNFLIECLSNKVSVNSLDKAGCTALHWAAHSGKEDCVKELLKIPHIQVNVQNKLGDTPLHSAAWKGNQRIVELLLGKGCHPLTMNNEQRTAYDLANDAATAAVLKPHMLQATVAGDEDYGDSDESE